MRVSTSLILLNVGSHSLTSILVPHIRPEERLMAAQQHQLLQAANAQHMAAMVALEAMQNQAKVSTFDYISH